MKLSRIGLPKLRAESDELLHLDALRFVAAIGVVVYHLAEIFALRPVTALGRLASSLNLFVDLFFTISGFVISWIYAGRISNAADYGRFMQKRIARIGPLHWLLLGAFVALAWISARLSHGAKPLSLDCFLPNLFFLHATGVCHALSFNYPSWSISAEMVMYALFPAYLVIARDWRRGAVVILAIAAALTIAIALTGSRPWWRWTYDFGVLRAIPAFLLGVVLYRIRAFLSRITAAPLLVWIALAAFFVASAMGAPKGAILLPLIYLIGGLGVAADLRGATSFVRRLGPAGQLTYSLYMWHGFLLAVITSATVQHLLGNPHGGRYRIFVSALMLTLLPVSYLSLFFFEQPARRWMGRLGAPPRASEARHGEHSGTAQPHAVQAPKRRSLPGG